MDMEGGVYHTDSIDLASFDTLEPRSIVVGVVRRTGERRADGPML